MERFPPCCCEEERRRNKLHTGCDLPEGNKDATLAFLSTLNRKIRAYCDDTILYSSSRATHVNGSCFDFSYHHGNFNRSPKLSSWKDQQIPNNYSHIFIRLWSVLAPSQKSSYMFHDDSFHINIDIQMIYSDIELTAG